MPSLTSQDISRLNKFGPYGRALYIAQEKGKQIGLSPFCLAALANRSPRQVLKDLDSPAEQPWIDIQGCGSTGLPVAFVVWWASSRGSSPADKRLPIKWVDEDLGRGYLERLLATYSGRDWKRYCKRDFHLPGLPSKNPDPEVWALMKKVFRRMPKVRGRAK